MDLIQLLGLPVSKLSENAKIPFRFLPDVPTLLYDFARAIANEIQFNNERGNPTRLILHVGTVAQYNDLIKICNSESISWKNVFVFQMDELLDWQGRRLPVNHPFSFEGFLRR